MDLGRSLLIHILCRGMLNLRSSTFLLVSTCTPPVLSPCEPTREPIPTRTPTSEYNLHAVDVIRVVVFEAQHVPYSSVSFRFFFSLSLCVALSARCVFFSLALNVSVALYCTACTWP